jgi:hypothetical protein
MALAAAAPAASKPDNSMWCTSFTVAGRASLVAIIFGTLLASVLMLAPSAAFASSGAYSLGISTVADFMTWALCAVLVENVLMEVIGTIAEASSARLTVAWLTSFVENLFVNLVVRGAAAKSPRERVAASERPKAAAAVEPKPPCDACDASDASDASASDASTCGVD